MPGDPFLGQTRLVLSVGLPRAFHDSDVRANDDWREPVSGTDAAIESGRPGVVLASDDDEAPLGSSGSLAAAVGG